MTQVLQKKLIKHIIESNPMKKKDLSELIAHVVTETLKEFVLNTQKLYKPKRRHIEKYRKSKYHPDEMEKAVRVKAIQQTLPQKPSGSSFNEPAYEIAPNIKIFLNTTLEAIPKSETSTKILHGVPIGKAEAMALARVMMQVPGFPFQQPRNLMNLLILLAAENAKEN